MAIKDLFSKQKEQSVEFRGANKKSVDEFRQDVESDEEIKQIRIEDSLVIPDLNYASASSFVKYGSAKKYYEDAIKRIYSQYPYDGSSAEKIAFKNEVTQLERYILDNEYPKSTGFAVFSPDGWGTAGSNDVGFYSSSLPEFITAFGWKKDQVWNTGSSQQQSFRLDFTEGRTVEFWFKKGSFPAGAEAIFDIRDTVNASASFGAYMLNTFNTNNLFCYYNNAVASNNVLFNLTTGLGSDNTDWHHYAIVYEYNDSDYTASLYIDGEFQSKDTATKTNVAQTGSLKLTIGALGGDFYNTGSLASGYGKLSGSLDEFRFWQEKRDAQQIGRNYFTVVDGGGNTDTSKTNNNNPLKLSCYFKFNEGKTTYTPTDRVVLDYSGRLANGLWTGYVSNSRDTGSAIVQSSAGTETGDPIIYSIHPDVQTLSTNLEASGTQHDAENVGSLQNSVPLWMLDEDTSTGGELRNLLQIMGSYLDSLHLQIGQISKFQNADYQKNNEISANPYNKKLLTSLGFDTPEFFIDKSVLETIINQDDKRKFEDKLNEIKNLIYKNIYNNLTYINKSKGTVKSIRNLLRCYGVDDDLFNFNVYANNAEYTLQDDFKNSSIKFDSLDLTPFANSQNTKGVIYNFAESGNSDSSPYISGSTDDYVGFTVETNAIFPKTPSTYQDSISLTSPAIVTASVFGVREANFTDQTTIIAPDAADISVRAIKNDNTAKFQLSSSMGVLLESERFYDVYDNSRWSLSARVKYDSDSFKDIDHGNYTLEFNGYNYEQDILQNSFALTASLSAADGAAFIGADKRVYAGAEKTNITGALSHRANMKLLSVLAWADYVEDDELKAHARDITSFGRKEAYDNTFTFSPSFDNVYIPRFDTLAMNLAFNQVTTSDSSGEFTVPDLSSGSISLVDKYGDYSKIVGIQNTAKGKGFATSADVKDIQYLNIMTQQIPENLNTDNMIKILENDDDLFFLDNRPVKYFFSLEASMYDTISREMLKTFAGVLDYGSMVGSIQSEYQTYNKELRTARENFFSRVENEPDLEKYVSLYKFLDSAIESVLFNLMPASADVSDRVRTVIENHIFERPGHKKHLYPGKSVTEKNDTKTSSNPKFEGTSSTKSSGFEPKVPAKCCKKNDTKCKSANPELPECFTSNKEEIVKTVAQIEVEGNLSVGKTDFQPYKIPLTQQAAKKAEEFLNSYTNKRFTDASDESGTNAWYAIIAERNEAGLIHSTDAEVKTRNSTHSRLKDIKILDTGRASFKGDYEVLALYGSQKLNQQGNIILPLIQPEVIGNSILLDKQDQIVVAQELVKNFVLYNVTLDETTANQVLQDPDKLPIKFSISGSGNFFGHSSASLMGHHLDTYYGNDFSNPLQGPFTEQHVGGYKHRHTELGTDHDRPELYKIESVSATQVKITNPRSDDAAGTYDFNIPRVKFSREELVKRAYNIKNIQSTTGSHHLGNFNSNYEVVNLNGRKENNIAFVQQGGFDETGSESTAVSGVIDFALPNRALSDGTHNKTVIVNRFSSPGEVATLSEGYLDVDSAEYSAYNALPYRNREMVNNLNKFNQTPSAFGGYESGSQVTGSYHKIQRNRVNKIKYNSDSVVYTGSSFDNGFVINNIPRKDAGYWWISSSLQQDLSMDGVYGFASSSDGLVFESGALRGVDEAEIINFANYSTPVSKIGTAGYHYELEANTNLILAPTAYTDGTEPASASIYFLNINGPYGYPSFKQLRTGQHPVARNLRENNVIIAGTETGDLRINHSPLSTKYKPILHSITSEESIGGERSEKDIFLKYTFGNNYDFYGNYYDYSGSKLDNPYREKNFSIVDKRQSLLYAVSNLYTRGNSAVKLNSMVYSENIYPKETNAYLSKARDRNRFNFNWRDNLSDRADQITGSQAQTSFSYWAMDTGSSVVGELLGETSGSRAKHPSANSYSVRYGRYRLLSGSSSDYVDITASSPKNTVQFGASDSAGQGAFEDTYSKWNSDIRKIAKDHTIVPEYKISDHIAGIISSGFDVTNNTYQSLSLTGSKATSNNEDFLETYAHSDNIPSIEIVRETQEKDADRISITLSAVKKLLPYDGFYPIQRTLQLSTLFSQSLGPNTTAVGSQASFQTVNNTIFSRLTYGSIRAGVATDTAIWTSGSLITNQVAASATAEFTFNGTGDPEGLRLALQSSQGTEFYVFDALHAGGKDGSVSNPFVIVGGTSTAATLAANTEAAINTSGTIGIVANRGGGAVGLTSSYDAAAAGNSNAFYAEDDGGVLGGKINSTGFNAGTVSVEGVTMHQLDFSGGLNNIYYNATANWSRLPFETIIKPSAYLNSNTDLIENDPQNQFNSTASVNFVGGTYELAASNFYAGVIDTFIQNKTLTTIKTKPQSQWSFSNSSVNNYVMDVVVTKPDDFTNHDDVAANGAPYTAHACFYQPLSSSGESWWSKHIADGTSNRATLPAIPPAASLSQNEAVVTINFDYNNFKNIVTDRTPNFSDILAYSTTTFKNKQMFEQLGATDASSTSSNSSQFMTIEAGVDLFNFDSKTEQWVINTKCEFPVHNFSSSLTFYPDGTSGGSGDSAGDANRGMWHQFSTSRESKLKLSVVSPDLSDNRESGSLSRACGFESGQKTISQIASSTKLKEYLVVIPFVTNECEEETFFHYSIDEFERAYASIPTGNPQPTTLSTSAIQTRSTTLTDSLARQRELILPPTLSYMTKRDNLGKRLEQEDYGPILPPFAMYVFEVEQDLNQEDLSKWWQGVLPTVGKKANIEKFDISHDIKDGEIISPSVLNNDIFGGKLPKEMRFKIFKAKYRRNLTYDEVKNNSLYGDDIVNSTIGYNYPHDFYSLIELAKIDLGLEYKEKSIQALSVGVSETGVTTVASNQATNIQGALSLLSEDEQ